MDGLNETSEKPLSLWDVSEQAEKDFGIPTGLLRGLGMEESHGLNHWDENGNLIKSNTGATGAFQFTRKTAKQYGINRENPIENILGAAKYLQDNFKAIRPLVDDENEAWLAASVAHNRGLGAVRGMIKNRTFEPAGKDSGNGGDTPAYAARIANNWADLHEKSGAKLNNNNSSSVDTSEVAPVKGQIIGATPAIYPTADGQPKHIAESDFTIQQQTASALQPTDIVQAPPVAPADKPAEFIPPTLPGEIPTFNGTMPDTETNPVAPNSAPIAPVADIENEYKKYLAYTNKADSLKTRQEFSQAVENNPEPHAEVSAKTNSPKVAIQPVNQEIAQPETNNAPRIENPTALAPGTSENSNQEIAGSLPFSKIYKTKPTAEQFYKDLATQNYGKNALAAVDAYRSITGEMLIEPVNPDATQSDIDNYWNPKTGEYTRATPQPIYAKVQRVVEAFENNGEQGIKDLLPKLEGKSNTAQLTPEQEDDFQSLVRAGNVADSLEGRAKFLKSLAEPNTTAAEDKEANLRAQAKDNIYNSPFSGGTEEEVEAEYERLKKSQLDPETAEQAKADADYLNENLGSSGASAIGGYMGSAARVFRGLAGISRPLSSLGIDAPYELFSKIAQKSEILDKNTGDGGAMAQLIKIGAGTPTDIARLAGLSRLPGGMVVGFAADNALQSAGRGENLGTIAKEGIKGAALGGVFGVAGKAGSTVKNALQKNLVNVVDAFPSNAAYKAANLTAKVFGEAAEIGTIAGGTLGVEKLAGTPDRDAAHSAIFNSLFHVFNKVGAKAYDKVYKIWENGKANNVYVDPQGKVKLLSGEVEPNYVDAEIITDPTSSAYKASEQAKNVTPSEKQPVSVKGEIGETIPPRELAEKNPLRVENPAPEALQKAQIDTRAQKINEVLKGKDAVSIDEIAKQTRINRNNVEDAVMTLYAARMVEILPDNSIRAISSDAAQTAPKSLYEKAAQIVAPKDSIKLEKSPIENEISSSDFTKNVLPDNAAPLAENNDTQVSVNKANETNRAESSITDKNASLADGLPRKEAAKSYENLPEQKPQETKSEKPVAKVIYAERPNISEKLNVFTERGTKASIEPKVIDSSDILTSLDEGYPQELQPRDRSRAASKAQISEIANKLNPEFLGDSPKASDGRPLVVPVEMPNGATKYAIISGNGRSEGIRSAYQLGKAGDYANFAKEKDSSSNHKEPVYVGVLDASEIKNLPEFAKEANESATAQMSATEQAKSDAERLDSDVLNLFVASDDGTIHGAANRDFTRAFLQKAVPTSEQGRLVDADGKLNQDGANRVRNAIFAKAFGESESGLSAITRMSESTDNSVKNITNGLLAKAGSLAALKGAAKTGTRYKEFDIASDLGVAMEKYAGLKDSGTSVEEYIQQGNLFGAETTPLQTRVMQVFDANKRSPKAIRSIIDNYLAAVEAIGNPNQQNLFGGSDKPGVESVFEGAVRAYEKSIIAEPTEQVGLFGQNQGREVQSEPRSQSNEDAQKTNQTAENQADKLGQNRLEDSPLYSKPTAKEKTVRDKFRNAVDDVLDGKRSPDTAFRLANESPVLKALGMSEKPLVIAGSTFFKDVKNKHFVTREQIKQLPELLDSPVLVLKSATQKGAKVVVLDSTDTKSRPLIAAIHLDRQVGTYVVNYVASMYGKTDRNFFEREIEKGNLEYVNKQKLPEWTLSHQLQLLNVVESSQAKQSILTNEDIVNDSVPPSANVLLRSQSKIDRTNAETDISNDNTLAPDDKPNYSSIERNSADKPTDYAPKNNSPLTRFLNAIPSDSNAMRSERLTKDIALALEKDFTEESLKLATVSPQGKLNEEAYVLIAHAHSLAFNQPDIGGWHGVFLNPRLNGKVRAVLDDLLRNAPASDRTRFLNEYDRATKPNGGMLQIASSKNIPEGLKAAWQEEAAHEADFLVGNEHEISKEIFSKDEIAQKAMAALKSGGYKEASNNLLAMEVGAKIWVDGRQGELNLTAGEVSHLQNLHIDAFIRAGKTIEEIRTAFAEVSNTAESFTQNYEQPNTSRQRTSESRGETDRRGKGTISEKIRGAAEGIRGIGRREADLLPATRRSEKAEENRANQVLEKDVQDEILYARATPQNLTGIAKILDVSKNVALDVISVPKSLKASVDISAAGRQGLILTVKHPMLAMKAAGRQFLSMREGVNQWTSLGKIIDARFGNYQTFKRDLNLHPLIDVAKDAGLYLSTLSNNGTLGARDEAFMSRLLADDPLFTNHPKIEQTRKLLISPVAASERAYVTYLDSIRMDTFAQQARAINEFNIRKGNTAAALGKDAYKEFVGDQMKGLASFINNATGRGGLGKLEDAAPYFNAGFFSIRYLTSRLQILNPAYYAKLPAGVRGMALKNMVAYVGAFAGALALLKLAGGDVGYDDPDDPNMLKVSFGDFHYDFGAGFVQPVRYLARMIQVASNAKTRGTKETDLTKKFIRSKLAPVPGSAWNLYTGKNFIGEDVTAGGEAKSLVTPMIFEDLPKAIDAEGKNGALKLIPAILGVGVSIYKPKESLLPNTVKTEIERLEMKMPDVAKKIKLEDKEIELTAEQYQAYRKDVLTTAAPILENVFSDPKFKEVPDAIKKKIIGNIMEGVRKPKSDELKGKLAEQK